VFPPPKQLEHPSRVLGIPRLAENLPVAFSHRIAPQDKSFIDATRDIGRFLERQSSHHFPSRLDVLRVGFRVVAGRRDFERVTRLGQQFPSPRRTAGQDDMWQSPLH
jgi:hypothetical protein